MIPYFFLVLCSFSPLLLLEKRIRKKSLSNISFVIFFFLLTVLLSLRADSIGNDTLNYIYIYQNDSQLSIKDIFYYFDEPFFRILMKAIYGIAGDHYRWMFFIIALITVIPIAVLFVKESDSPIITISIFLISSNFVMLFSGLRQSIAIALGVVAYYFVKKRKVVLYFIIVIIAVMFHNSAFMLILMYPLYHLRLTTKSLYFIVPTFLVVWIFNKPIFLWLSSFISDMYEVTIKNTGAISMLLLLVMFVAFSFVIPNEEKIDDDTIGLRNLLLLCLFVQIFASINSLAMRLNYYYLIFLPILVPKIINKSTYSMGQVAVLSKVIISIFFLAYFFIISPGDNSLNTFPYLFYWQN